MKVGFYTKTIDPRGTCVALYDYSHYNELLLGNESLIFTSSSSVQDETFIKFSHRFRIVFANSKEELHQELIKNEIDVMYTIEYGKDEGLWFSDIKTCVHCVFDMSQPHGDVYAGVSKSLAQKYGKTLYVPHMISMKKSKYNLRKELGIPESATVFGRYGGMDTFDLEFARQGIIEILTQTSNVYFLFMNTPMFHSNPRCLFLAPCADMEYKSRFINTCDAHLECGRLGHSFGLSIGEFSIHNKPIIAYNGNVWNTAHIDILKDKGLYFGNKEEFKNLLLNFDKNSYKNIDNNCYREYSPEKVMEIFNRVFLARN